MGSIPDENHRRGDDEALTILVTGFCPFQEKYPVNPSFEITRSLPDHLPATPSQPTAVRIIPYGTPVRVAYDDVRELVPKMHDAYAGTVDLVLHIGMASGRTFYSMERYGHRDDYSKNKDLDGKMPLPDEGKTTFSDCPSRMTTSLSYDDILVNWQRGLSETPGDNPGHDADARASEDAGHYLCDYIYFNSLAYFGRKHGSMEGGRNSDRPVLFLHVPAESDEGAIDRGREVTIALIRAMADSFSKAQRGLDRPAGGPV